MPSAAPSAVLRRPPQPAPPRRQPSARTRLFALSEVGWAAAAAVAFLLALPLHLTGAPAWTWGPLYTLAYATGGWEPAWSGLRALKDRTLDVDLLMVLAAIGAAAIGQVLDGALLIVIFAGSGALEALATARTEDSVRGLLDLAPSTATRLTGDGGDPDADPDAGPHAEENVAAADLVVGDVILVRPGERVGADGRVLDGSSEVDQATITGELLPVAKQPGDEVFAGTLNGTGALRVEVERDAGDSVIARIAAMVAEASGTKAPTQLFIEKVEQRYSVGMVAATLAVFTVPLLFGAEPTGALLRAMTFMIVASPCAVVLATMPPLLAAVANAGRHGVLVKSAVVMERLGEVDTVASLQALTGRMPMLLTGDNPRAAARPAAATGIVDVRAGLLPQDKVEAVRAQQTAGRRVLVVGDGVNDAPALAAAHTGVAMGRAGSDLAMETADAVIVRDELATVPAVLTLSRAARRLVVQNLCLAAVFLCGLVVWDLAGDLPLPLGVLGHEGSTVLVGLNGLRLLRDTAWRRAARAG
ncbi:HAD-IC family P-type ATPase [Streptomyces sirii]|uniref:HAD-IC family P-type ATPase n=1 Tax=Streptomyces sirii TaxID=3127701 RepID=UPI003D35AA37